MPASAPEQVTRRIAVILGPGRSSRNLLDVVTPLLRKDRALEMQGVFLEEAELRHAADLPFVKELCRVTFSVQEFNTDQFERVLALRMRSAQRALGLLARRAGISHSFRNVRGSAESLLRETVGQSDITIFEPAGELAASLPIAPPAPRFERRIVVYVADARECGAVLTAALQLAGGDARRLSILIDRGLGDGIDQLEKKMRSILPAPPGSMTVLSETAGHSLTAAIRAEDPAMLVLSATGDSIPPQLLTALRKRLRCPVCLVRYWTEPAN